MPESVIEIGEKLHIITRRNFAEDLRRHFVGSVQAVALGEMRVIGYAFVFNPIDLAYRRRPEIRTRVFNTSGSMLIINVLPQTVRLDLMKYVMDDGRLIVTDGSDFRLDVNEFGATH